MVKVLNDNGLATRVTIALVLFLMVQCRQSHLQSIFTSTGITIDGATEEWQNSLFTISGSSTAVGCMNDDRYLYLCFVSYDKSLQRRLLHGSTTFTFSQRTPNHTYREIRLIAGPGIPQRNENYRRGVGDISDSMDVNHVNHEFRLIELPGVLPGTKTLCSVAKAESLGVHAAMNPMRDGLGFEMALPFSGEALDSAFSLGLSKETPFMLRVEVEAPEFSPGALRGPPPVGGGGRMGGGPPGGGGGMQGHGGPQGGGPPGGPGGRPSTEEKLSYTLHVRLATATSTNN